MYWNPSEWPPSLPPTRPLLAALGFFRVAGATPLRREPLRRELLDRVRKCRSNAFSDARILEDQAESLASNGWVGPASEELNGGVDCWVEGGRKTGV